jgi:hypothetical protein
VRREAGEELRSAEREWREEEKNLKGQVKAAEVIPAPI